MSVITNTVAPPFGPLSGVVVEKKATRKRARNVRESDVELLITNFLNAALPQDAMHFHIANEGKRGRRQQAEFKKAGGKAGVPDRCILWRGNAYFLEAKKPGGKLNADQHKLIPQIKRAGCPVEVVRSVDDARAALISWGVPLNEK